MKLKELIKTMGKRGNRQYWNNLFIPIIVVLIIIFISGSDLYSQSQFRYKVKDFEWKNPSGNYAELQINMLITNIGDSKGWAEDLQGIGLNTSNNYDASVEVIEYSENTKQNIDPGRSINGYIVFKVNKIADDLTLKFDEKYGGASKYITGSYNKSHENEPVTEVKDQVKDIDGNIYKTVTIGTQEWTAENLNVSKYRNGDVIPQVQDKNEWSNLTTGAWCYYENKTSNGKTYGKLYNWYAVVDYRGLAPKGWHIPSDAEWSKLTDYLGGDKVAGGKLKARTLWNSPNTGATNSSGFTAFPGGVRYSIGLYNLIGKYGYFWSASEDDYYLAWYRGLGYDYSVVSRSISIKEDGFSIRCVRD